jgi:serine/threonine protein kinase
MSPDKPDGEPTHDTDFAAMWSSDGMTRSVSPTAAATSFPADLPFLFSAGQRFGPYLIVRPLGKGGMGQVYEAEETDSGRRVAIKILSRGLGDDEERERFLREGQLAAALSHPNTVYVFGTTEVQGFPVIAMELAPGGTLKDLVADTPLAPSAAVDAILQVIAGLDAAASIGILHRDIKPSNCFVDRDGRVLVGDFGLSVATSSRDARGMSPGIILGTPGFASPEQLRSESLDVRSDIYAVGATLFYLLAGRAPFEDASATALITRIATEPAPSLTTVRPELPRRLAAIVAKCLAKSPGDRFPTYATLAAALEPFASTRLAPAPITRRVLAGIVDSYLVSLPTVPVNLWLQLRPVSAAHRADAAIVALMTVVAMMIYYGALEGMFGAAAGKALFGLRVVDVSQVAPGPRRAMMRALVFGLPSQVISLIAGWLILPTVSDISPGFVSGTAGVVWLAILFSTARKANGYAALHDRASRTRVVRSRATVEARDRLDRAQSERSAVIDPGIRIGPYLVPAGTAVDVQTAVRVDGFDDRLERRVWIELLPTGSPPLPALRRDLGRPTRARWLGGRRGSDGCWDAYEAIDARPFADVARDRQPWSRVRHWLSDLAQEMAAGLDDGSLPPLDVSRVWVGHDDRVRILEWPDPAAASREVQAEKPDLLAAQRLLYGLSVAALLGLPYDTARDLPPRMPLPLQARALLLSLRDAQFTSAAALLGGVSSALQSPAAFSRSRRATQIALSAALPIVMMVVTIGGVLVLRRSTGDDRQFFTLDACLNELESVEKTLRKAPTEKARQTQQDLEIYLAEHLASTIENPDTWTRSFPNVGARGGRARARHALDAHRVRSPEEVRRADATVASLVEGAESSLQKLATPQKLWVIALAIFGGTYVIVIFFNAIGALAGGGGFSFRAVGAALVNARGEPASRLRALSRAAVTWSPIFGMLAVLEYGPKLDDAGAGTILLQSSFVALLLVCAAWAIMRPSRSIQDRIAGTWIVPR